MIFRRLFSARPNSSSMCSVMHKNGLGSTAFLKQAVLHLQADQNNKFSSSEKNSTALLCSSFNSIETDSYIVESLDPGDYKGYVDHMRNLLYPTSLDVIINRLKRCNTVKQVLDIVSEYSGELDVPHICQSVLMLQQIRLFPSLVSSYKSSNLTDLQTLTTNTTFQTLLNLLDNSCSSMNFTELSYCLLYLNKLGVSFTQHDLLIKFVTNCEKKIQESPFHEVPLNAVLKFCAALRSHPTLWSLYTLKNVLPLLTDRLKNCDTYDEFYFITLCLHKMALLVNESLLDTYREKCSQLFQNFHDYNGVARLNRIKAIEKAVAFLDHNAFYGSNINSVKKLLRCMEGSVELLSVHDLYALHKRIKLLQEPALLLKEISDICAERLERIKFGKLTFSSLLLGIMSSRRYLPFSQTDIDDRITNYLNQASFYQSVTCFALMNQLMQSDIFVKKELIILYWKQLLEIMNLYPSNQLYDQLIGACIRYLSFKSVISTFAYEPFEQAVIIWLLKNVQDENVYPRSYVFTKIMALFMTFSDDNVLNSTSLREATDKMEQDICRLNISDNTNVSFILSSGLNLKQIKKSSRSMFLEHYVRMTTALHENSRQSVRNERNNNAVTNLNDLLLGYLYRKGSINTDIFKDLVDRYENVTTEELNSRLIRKSLGAFFDFKCIVPRFVDTCFLYCIQNQDIIHVNTAGILLTYAFNFGYWPNKLHELLDVTCNLLERDNDSVDHFSMLKCCLCFAYFNHLPYSLTKKIFNLDYIRKLEKYLFHMHGRITGTRLKSILMELNRSVCIDYPEYNVPWFHEDFNPINTKYLKDTNRVFYREVLDVLSNIITDENLIVTNHFSPYNHHIDFFIRLKEDGTLVNPLLCSDDSNTKKVAILLQSNSSESYYFNKGKYEMCRRHLEILNYKVIEIRRKYWNSMFMSEPMAKLSYVKDQIYSVK